MYYYILSCGLYYSIYLTLGLTIERCIILLLNQRQLEILLELKATEFIVEAFENQLLNYLRGTDCEVGLLLNFGKKPEFKRRVFENKRKIRKNH